MITAIIEALWFFAPAGYANMAPVPAAKIPWTDRLAVPIDGGLKVRGRRLFGDHKTIRGFIAGYLTALVIVLIQVYLHENVQWFTDLALFDYSSMNPFWWAFLASFGALGGDAIKSFFKRQFDVQPGKAWFPFDQIDYIVGGILLMSISVNLTFAQVFTILIVFFLLHPVATTSAYLLKMKDSPI